MNQLLEQITREHGTPCFVYFLDEIRARIDSVRQAFGGRFLISYAIKCNPNPTLVRRLIQHVDWLDISSGGELERALRDGWKPDRLSFTGPAKRDSELSLAVDQRVGAIVVESIGEAERLSTLAAKAGVIQLILVRIAPMKLAPGFGVNMAGKPTQFGIDEEEIDSAVKQLSLLTSVRISGFHIYAGTQCLRADAIIQSYRGFIELFRRVCESNDIAPEKLIFGSGLGIPYYEQDQPVDLAAIGTALSPDLDQLRREARYAKTQLILETGRYLVGEAGLYLTRVVSAKHSRGTEIRICDGGMNHHLGACGHLGSVIHRNYRMFKVGDEKSTEVMKSYDLFGPLCTSIDMLGHGVRFPNLEIGDVIAIRNSGAYGLTASPVHFISHAPPREIMIENIDGRIAIEDVSFLPAAEK